MAFIDENTQFYKQLYNHSKNMYTTAIVAFFATGPGWFLKFFELNFSLHIYFKVFHSLQNIHFLSWSTVVVIFRQVPAGIRSLISFPVSSWGCVPIPVLAQRCWTSTYLRPFVESWQQEFVTKIFHKSQLESFLR